MELPDIIISAIKDLKFNSLTTVLFSCNKTDITWLYVPSHNYRSHRVGYQSALTPNACPSPNEGCAALEIIGDHFNVNSLLDRDDVLPEELGFNRIIDSQFSKYAYVIHDLNYRKNTEAIFLYFERIKGFELLGRWGTWNYKNMDLCMLDAINLVKRVG